MIAVALWAWLGGRSELESGSVKPATAGGPMTSAQAAPAEAETLEQAFTRIAEQVGPAVVSISTEQIERVRQYFRVHPFFRDELFDEFFRQFYGDVPEREFRRYGLGSGVLINAKGSLLTNEHVVAGADKITVTLADGREFIGTVTGKDVRSDLAVIKIDAQSLPVAGLGDSGRLKVGQWVVALGNPLGLAGMGISAATYGAEPTLSVGVISALHRQLPHPARVNRDYSDLIQTDATINPGNSGGPLVNLRGEVIGVNVAIITGPGNAYGFAIPVNTATRILEALIEGRRIVYGWLGVQIQDLAADVAEFYKLSDREGVLVYHVLPDSPATRADLRNGDIVKAFNGEPVRTARELVERVSQAQPGGRAILQVLRDGRLQTLTVEIGERPSEEALAEGAAAAAAWRGLVVNELTSEVRERFHLPADMTGVLVVEIEDGSPADEAGLQPGDVINEINRVRIEHVPDYHRVVAQVEGHTLVRTNRGYVVVKASR
jgi:serine protease Do